MVKMSFIVLFDSAFHPSVPSRLREVFTHQTDNILTIASYEYPLAHALLSDDRARPRVAGARRSFEYFISFGHAGSITWTPSRWETSPAAPPTDEKETKIGQVQFSKAFETQQATASYQRLHGHCRPRRQSQPQRSHQCVSSLLEGNRIPNGEGSGSDWWKGEAEWNTATFTHWMMDNSKNCYLMCIFRVSKTWQKRQQAVCVRHAFKHYGSKKRPNHVLSNLNMTVAKGTIDVGRRLNTVRALAPIRTLRLARCNSYSDPPFRPLAKGKAVTVNKSGIPRKEFSMSPQTPNRRR
ncbi:hypothetical protein EVAR_53673_1 [Eumeta japonica]|uniref:Uncharacterized protein n=1 Tax=Eumeta variegata TaxID=151549 RepID=A0A4C1YLK9_EUMVA|nr:hypothetical protein EVAR_53673_1 [Eumeta japonica]